MRTNSNRLATASLALPLALNTALQWWDRCDALVDLDLAELIERVPTAARDLGCVSVGDLHANAAAVITRVTGIVNIHQFASTSDADALHAARNVIAAIVLAAHVLNGSDDHAIYDHIRDLTTVAPRHGAKDRPARDDEVLLLRTATMHSLQRSSRYVRSAITYAVAESGAHPVETTAVRPTDFDSLVAPTTVHLDGSASRWYRARRLPLTSFARHVIREGINAHLAADPRGHQSRLCFNGAISSASASSSNILKHLAERVGIIAPSLEGSYATRWRAHKEMKDNGVGAALILIGKGDPQRDRARLTDFLNIPADATTVAYEVEDWDTEDLLSI